MSIPPLSQSKQALMSCPHRYLSETVYGQKQIQGEAARIGNDCHYFLNEYVRRLVKEKHRRDLQYFDFLAQGLLPDARELLEPLRETFEIDPDKVFATEQRIAMNEKFEITPEGLPGTAYQMTLDLIELPQETLADLTDYKSQFQAIDPNTFQARLYSLGLMTLNPQIEQVTFRLRFLRWGKIRSVTFGREMVPGLQAEARMWRERQIALHKEVNPAPALPGSHCVYCSLLGDGCPVEKNPYEGVESHLLKAIYFQAAYKKSYEILKAHCDQGGPVKAKDYIGTEYQAAWGVSDQKKFGVDVLPVLQRWDKAHKSDPVMPRLSISGLGTLIRAKKRSDLAEACADYCEMQTRPRFKIGKSAGEEDEADDE